MSAFGKYAWLLDDICRRVLRLLTLTSLIGILMLELVDINLGTPVLQCQVPTWLGEFGDVKPNHTSARVYVNGQKHAQVKRKRAS